MSLFSDSELDTIRDKIVNSSTNILITFRHNLGPTKLQQLWEKLLTGFGFHKECVSWWSSSGTIGLLECEVDSDRHVYGQWALADYTELLGVFEVSDDELGNIREGFDAQSVTSSVMRALRIGEKGED